MKRGKDVSVSAFIPSLKAGDFPPIRLKKRYIGFRVTSEKPYTKYEVLNLVLKELQTINRTRPDKTRIKLLEYEGGRGLGILQCDHKSVNTLRCLFNGVNEKNKGKITIKTLGVSGTIKSLRHKFLDKTI